MLGASNSWRLLLAALILLAVLLAATGALVALLVSLTAIDLREDYVAVVELSGAIDYSYGGLFSGPVITPHSVETLVERVLSDPRARAVVIVVNSPGGTAAAFEVYEILRKLYEERVVVVYITGLGASGGYLISLPSHAIVAHPTAIVGSVGAIGILVSYKELLDKLGIDAEVVVSGDLKDFASPFKEIESEDVELLSRIIRDVADYFVSLVEKHRGDRITDWREVMRAGVYSGYEAKKLGLVDYVGTLEDAVRIARELAELPEDAPVVKIRKEPSLLELLMGFSSSKPEVVKRDVLSVEILVMWPLPRELPQALVISVTPGPG